MVSARLERALVQVMASMGSLYMYRIMYIVQSTVCAGSMAGGHIGSKSADHPASALRSPAPASSYIQPTVASSTLATGTPRDKKISTSAW